MDKNKTNKMLSEKQANQIKEQLIKQIESTFPQDKKAFAISQIKGMSAGQLIEFLKQNKMISEQGAKQLSSMSQAGKAKQSQKKPSASEKPAKKKTSENQELATTAPAMSKCIFCSIINKEIPSFQIDENKSAIAILEINPISKGHVLIIPKNHISSKDKLPQQAFSLAKKISRKLKSRLKKPKPQDVEIAFTNLFGHEVINVFPVYKNEKISSERYHEDKKTLEKLKKKLEKKTSKKKSKASKKKPSKKKSKGRSKSRKKAPKLWLPKRIP